ncbi:reverse transcriptase domain-containing protein [Tanacetum coccineum]
MEVFIGGLPKSIEGNVTASMPQTLEEAITITQRLMDQETFRSYAATPTENSRYTGSIPLCKKCTMHHTGPCTVKCQTCNKVGHLIRNCRNKGPATRSNQQPVSVICHACGEKGHYNYQCSKTNNSAHRRAYLLRDKNAHRDPNIVTCTFLLNQYLARVLLDSGADKSFVSISLASMLNIPPITLDTTYDIEMANGNLVGSSVYSKIDLRSGYHQLRVRDEVWKRISDKRTKNEAKTDKTEHRMEERYVLYVFICVCVGYVRLHNQSIERDRLIGIGFVLDFVELISFTFGDKEMILVIEAVSR